MDTAELASLRRLLWFQVEDPRCFLIKFADRTHNMRTIYAVDPEKAKGVANETLQVWCYFAEQMGMFATKAELEDLSFAVRDPAAFRAVIDARIDEWVVNEGVDAESRREAKKKRKAKEEEEARRLRSSVPPKTKTKTKRRRRRRRRGPKGGERDGSIGSRRRRGERRLGARRRRRGPRNCTRKSVASRVQDGVGASHGRGRASVLRARAPRRERGRASFPRRGGASRGARG